MHWESVYTNTVTMLISKFNNFIVKCEEFYTFNTIMYKRKITYLEKILYSHLLTRLIEILKIIFAEYEINLI